MKKIVLMCSNGMSTSLMVAKMREAAAKAGYECTINAYSLAAAKEVGTEAASGAEGLSRRASSRH